MAQAAKVMVREESETLGSVVPMRAGPLRTATELEPKEWNSTPRSVRLDEGTQRATSALLSAKQSVGELFRNVRRSASRAYGNISSASRDLTTRFRRRSEQIKEDNPLQLLAVIAGSAFVLGVVTRIWRSRHHA
jgi:hypothetical protein